jgi:hypothetical protein
MNAEQITAMIQALGYPVCVSIALFVVFRQFMQRFFKLTDVLVQRTDEQSARTEAHAERLASVSDRSNATLDRNSIAIKENTEVMRLMTGKLCRFEGS